MANKKKHVDHLGTEFESQCKMCEQYGISASTYLTRINRGLSVEQALTMQTHRRDRIIDHLGNEYNSQEDMCRAYNIETNTFLDRMNRGWDLGRALTEETDISKVSSRFACKDHLGISYNSVAEMCTKYGISRPLFRYRLQSGMNLEDALTKPISKYVKGAG